MPMEQNEIRSFLRNQTPFDTLDSFAFASAIRNIQIFYLCKTNQDQLFESSPPCLYLVRSGCYLLVDQDGQPITQLIEGDYFGYPTLLTGNPASNRIETRTDGLIYCIEQTVFDQLRGESKSFERYFNQALNKRLLSNHYKNNRSGWSDKKIVYLMNHGAKTSGPDASIRQVAKKMSKYGVSSLLITENEKLVGIVTDRDLRNRVLAREVDSSEPVSLVMTRNLIYVYEHNRVFSAFHLMLKHNVHHLPVLDENCKPTGVITSNDLLLQQKSDPVQLIGHIYKASELDELRAVSREIPILLRVFSGNLDDTSLIGKILSGITDALTSRLLSLFQEEHGAAPTTFSWICFGSQAREEMTLDSDQDNALLLPDSITEEQREYFSKMASFVCQSLAECGIKSCPGNIMASNPDLQLTFTEWQEKFRFWLDNPSSDALLKCKIFFDMRHIEGDLALFHDLHIQITELQKTDIFFANLALDINSHQVPLGLFKQLKLQSKKRYNDSFIDVKSSGIAIVNDLTRFYAMQHKVHQANTLERLDALSKQPTLNSEDIYDLKDCWRFLTQLRLKAQFRREGLPENCVNPANLTSLERHQLKEAFFLIRQGQQALAFKYTRGSL